MPLTPGIGTVATPDQVLDKADLVTNIRRAATGFRAMGLAEGNVVAMMLRNDLPFLETLYAANWIGAYITPINWHLRGEEVRVILADSGADVLVVHADLLLDVRSALPDGIKILVVEPAPAMIAAYRIAPEARKKPADLDAWADWRDRHDPLGDPMMGRFTMIYTSGTTAQPKGVTRAVTDPDAIQRSIEGVADTFGLWDGMKAIMTGPMYHSATFTYSMSAMPFHSDFFMMPKFDAEELLRLIDTQKAEAMHMVPTMFSRLLRLPKPVREKYDVSSLKYVTHGAAPCPPNVKRAMIDWWGPVIYEYYGSTEAGIVSISSSEEWLARPGTLGRAREMTPTEVRGPDGQALPPGEEGELYMRLNPGTQFNYRNKPDRDDGTRDGAWFTNGDIGYLDEDGYIFLCDRKKDMIISGGVNIYPSEIEGVICDHPAVRDCAVFGIPNEDFGESVAAAIELSGALPDTVTGAVTDDTIRAHVGERLARFKVPRVVTFHTALPREETGKIFKRKLRDPYWAGRDKMI